MSQPIPSRGQKLDNFGVQLDCVDGHNPSPHGDRNLKNAFLTSQQNPHHNSSPHGDRNVGMNPYVDEHSVAVTTHPLTGPKKRHAAASHCNMPLSYTRTGPNCQPPTVGSFFVRKKCVLEQPVKQIQNDESPHGNPPLTPHPVHQKTPRSLGKEARHFYSSAPRHTPRFSCKRSRTSLSSMDAIHWEKSSSIIRAA